MKKSLMLLVCLTGLLLFATVTATAQTTINLRFAHQNPDTGWSSINCVDPWLKQVEEATNGRVKIQAYYGQTLTKGRDMWDATKTGITDMAWAFHGYWPGLTPLSDVMSLPGLPFDSAEKGSEVFWKLYEQYPEIRQEFDDVKVLLLYTSEPYTLITRTKQVKTLEDIQGMKLRMTGGPPTDMTRLLGAVPMLIPMPDNYLSLQRGVIDGMAGPWEAIHVFRFYEVVNYYTEAPFPAVYFSIIMNKNKWNSLPPDVQESIMGVGGLQGSRFWGRHFFDEMKNITMKQLEAVGHKDNVYRLPPEERARWLEVAIKPVWKSWIEDMESKGHTNAQAILDTVLELSVQ